MSEKTKVPERNILKPCPFCGNKELVVEKSEFSGVTHISCEPCQTGFIPIDVWNTRANEDLLAASLINVFKKLNSLEV